MVAEDVGAVPAGHLQPASGEGLGQDRLEQGLAGRSVAAGHRHAAARRQIDHAGHVEGGAGRVIDDRRALEHGRGHVVGRRAGEAAGRQHRLQPVCVARPLRRRRKQRRRGQIDEHQLRRAGVGAEPGHVGAQSLEQRRAGSVRLRLSGGGGVIARQQRGGRLPDPLHIARREHAVAAQGLRPGLAARVPAAEAELVEPREAQRRRPGRLGQKKAPTVLCSDSGDEGAGGGAAQPDEEYSDSHAISFPAARKSATSVSTCAPISGDPDASRARTRRPSVSGR